MFAFKKGMNFTIGAGISTLFVLKMDDLIYYQIRRHLIHPIYVLTNQKEISSNDIKDLGTGTRDLIQQFKPHGLQKVSAKKLLIDDKDYSTPSDHYFSFLNKRDESPDQLDIIKSLPMDSVITEK